MAKNDMGALVLGLGLFYLITRKKGLGGGGFWGSGGNWIKFTPRGGYYIRDAGSGLPVEVAYGAYAKSYRKYPDLPPKIISSAPSRKARGGGGGISLHGGASRKIGGYQIL